MFSSKSKGKRQKTKERAQDYSPRARVALLTFTFCLLPFAFVLLSLVIATGCGASVAGPTNPIDRPFTIGVGEATTISGAGLVIEFTGVSGDSRCPADALCIQGGDAVVDIRVTGNGTASYELHTGDASRATVAHGRYVISLVELQPYPFSSNPVNPGEYRATLLVQRE
jgi:hypothetical protein